MNRWFAIALGLALIAGCNKAQDDGPPCAKVVDHMLDLMKSTAGGHGGMNLGSRQTMITTCEQRHMPKETRACLVNSKDITGLANCSHTTMPPGGSGQRELGAPPSPAAPPPTAPPPATAAPDPGSAGSGTPPP